MQKINKKLIFLMVVVTLVALIYFFQKNQSENAYLVPVPQGTIDLSLGESETIGSSGAVSSDTSVPPASPSTINNYFPQNSGVPSIPWRFVDWFRVLGRGGEIAYYSGDLAIKNNGTFQLRGGSVTSSTLARHAIESEHLGTASVTSRTIENGSILGSDISESADLIIATLTVAGATTFNGLAYSWPATQTASGILTTDGSGGLTWATVGASAITPDSLDFTEFKDAMTLDASTDISLGALTLSTSGTGTIDFANTGVFTVAGDTTLEKTLTVGSSATDPGRISFAHAAGQGPFVIDNSIDASDYNAHMNMGYNVGATSWPLIEPNDRGAFWGIEANYDQGNDGPTNNVMEMYGQYQHQSGFGDASNNTYLRWIMTQINKDTNQITGTQLVGGPVYGIDFNINDSTGTEFQKVIGIQKMNVGLNDVRTFVDFISQDIASFRSTVRINDGAFVGTEPTYNGNLTIESGQTNEGTNGLEFKSTTLGHGYRIATILDSSSVDLRFQGRHISTSWTDLMTIRSNGGPLVGIGDTSPDYTLELHNATTTPTLALSDDDVAHGFTSIAQADVFSHFSTYSTNNGGAQWTGISDTNAQALVIRGLMGTDNPGDSVPAIKLIGAKHDGGTGLADLGTAETVFQVANNDDAAAMTILGDGKVGIGTTSPAAARLQVKGAGATSSTLSAQFQNSSDQRVLRLADSGAIFVGDNSGAPQIFNFTNNSISSIDVTGRGLSFYTSQTPTTTSAVGFGFTGGNMTPTSGSGHLLTRMSQTFAPTSGSAVYATLGISPIINQTGGANGITRGIHVEPTLTAAADFRALEMSNTSGFGVYQSGASALNYFAGDVGIGTTSPSTLLEVRGTSTAGVMSLSNSEGNVIDGTGLGKLGFRSYDASDSSAYTGEAAYMSAIARSTYGGGLNNARSALIFATNNDTTPLAPVERMRIDYNGNVGIGTTTLPAKLTISGGEIYSATPAVATIALGYGPTGGYSHFIHTRHRSGVPDDNAIDFYTGTGTNAGVFPTNAVFGMTIMNGSVGIGDTTPDAMLDVKGTVCLDLNADEACTDNTAALSDARLKGNVRDITGGLDLVSRLRPVYFTWNGKNHTGGADSLGFLAQEVEDVFPELVITDTAGYKNLDYSKLTAVLASAIQEQQTEIGSITLKTDSNITTVSELQSSVDKELLSISGSLLEMTEEADDQGEDIETLASDTDDVRNKVKSLSDSIELLNEQMVVLSDLFADARLENILLVDDKGNVNLLEGKLQARILETGVLIIEITDTEAPTLGQATLKQDTDQEKIKTKAASGDARIFVTPMTASALEYPLTVIEVNSGESFTIGIPENASEDIEFNWWIVEEK